MWATLRGQRLHLGQHHSWPHGQARVADRTISPESCAFRPSAATGRARCSAGTNPQEPTSKSPRPIRTVKYPYIQPQSWKNGILATGCDLPASDRSRRGR